MTIITEKLVDSQIVVVYQLNTAPGKYFISSCKDFSDKYSTRQLYSSIDLKFSGNVYGSVYKDKVLRYVDRQLNDYPYLKDAPKNMLIASGIIKRQEEFNLKPEEVQKLAEEMEQVSKIPMDLPIINYVKCIITIVEHVKQNSDLLLKSPEAFNIAIVRVLKGLTLDETAIGLIKSVVNIVLPEALKPQTKDFKDESNDLGFGESDLNELAPAGSPDIGEETLNIPDRGLADNDPRKKYDDLKFNNKQMSPQSLERHKQHLMDEYLDELVQAKSEGNVERVEKINRMLQYLSAESSLNFFEEVIMERLGGLHSAREMNLPLSHECRECGRNTMDNSSGLCAECRNPSAYPEQRYRPSKGLEFGVDYEYGSSGKTPKAEVSGGLKFEE
jgi:ribosomal protein L37E